jgi:hypothetical protein
MFLLEFLRFHFSYFRVSPCFGCQVPVYLIWLRAISPYNYGFQNFAIEAWRDITLFCTPAELLPNGSCLFTSGQQVQSAFCVFETFEI